MLTERLFGCDPGKRDPIRQERHFDLLDMAQVFADERRLDGPDDRFDDGEQRRITMAGSDTDHPGLDDAFWAGIEAPEPSEEAISIKLDNDVLQYFRKAGRGYQTRINAVLRGYMQAKERAR